MFKQGKPDEGGVIHYCDDREEVLRRDRLLGNEFYRALCGHGGYHMFLTHYPTQVTCQACLAKMKEIEDGPRCVSENNP